MQMAEKVTSPGGRGGLMIQLPQPNDFRPALLEVIHRIAPIGAICHDDKIKLTALRFPRLIETSIQRLCTSTLGDDALKCGSEAWIGTQGTNQRGVGRFDQSKVEPEARIERRSFMDVPKHVPFSPLPPFHPKNQSRSVPPLPATAAPNQAICRRILRQRLYQP